MKSSLLEKYTDSNCFDKFCPRFVERPFTRRLNSIVNLPTITAWFALHTLQCVYMLTAADSRYSKWCFFYVPTPNLAYQIEHFFKSSRVHRWHYGDGDGQTTNSNGPIRRLTAILTRSRLPKRSTLATYDHPLNSYGNAVLFCQHCHDCSIHATLLCSNYCLELVFFCGWSSCLLLAYLTASLPVKEADSQWTF